MRRIRVRGPTRGRPAGPRVCPAAARREAPDDGHPADAGYVEQSYERDTRYLADRITADGGEGWPVEPGATAWSSAGPARGPAGR